MLVSLTVGKVDAGVAVLLTEDKRIIEFPSVLLPPDIHSGSIVDVNVSRNLTAESAQEKRFNSLQTQIYQTFGLNSPSKPILRCRNTTQTSIVLEWDPIDLATAELRSLSLYRNGSKAGNIPRPSEMRSTKISGLALDMEYNFQLVLRTSAGTYSSERLVVRTHKMTELSGITVTPGIMPSALKDSLGQTLEKIGGRLIDTVRIDTTHFVCTEGRGQAWERAVEMNIPVVVPDWVKGCEREGRIVGVRGYYLNADPKLRQVGTNPAMQTGTSGSSMGPPNSPPQRHVTPTTMVTPPTPERPIVERTRGSSRLNGQRTVAEEPDEDDTKPTPPPKSDAPRPTSAVSGSTLAETASEVKSKDSSSGDEEEDEDESEEVDKATGGGSRTDLPIRSKPTGEDAPEEEASFHDVAL